MSVTAGYVGRYAPSPSGPLHAGSLVAALASYLDARAHHGRWLLRIEDVDTPRVMPGAADTICQQLQAMGLQWDGPLIWQSQRGDAYTDAFTQLHDQGLIYGCGCTRREIADSAALRASTLRPAIAGDGTTPDTSTPGNESPYPGTCRHGLAPGRQARAWRLRVPAGVVTDTDRWLGPQRQDVAHEVGDFILRRADGLWAYQLAVVVDDAAQGVTHVVRGADLLSSTARQRVLQRLLHLPEPAMMHVPLVTGQDGRKLSKQNGAAAFDDTQPLQSLQAAWHHLGFAPCEAGNVSDFLTRATQCWATRWGVAA